MLYSDNMIGADNQQATSMTTLRESSETIRQTPRLSCELACIIALLFTDGCLSPKGKSWRIYFANKSDNLIVLFRDCMVKEFALPIHRVRIAEIRGANGVKSAVVDSKVIGCYLVERFGTFRTLRFENGELPNARLPLLELLKSDYARDFLQVAFSCDGGVSLYSASRGSTRWLIRTIFLSCAHPGLRLDYLTLLASFDVHARDVPDDGKLKIENELNIRKFQRCIGFADGTMVTNHSLYWRGHTKQDVLERMIASYGNPVSVLRYQCFKRDDDIVQPA